MGIGQAHLNGIHNKGSDTADAEAAIECLYALGPVHFSGDLECVQGLPSGPQ